MKKNEIQRQAKGLLADLVAGFETDPGFWKDLLNYRETFETSAGQYNLKRCAGGTMDIEFLAQAGTLGLDPITDSPLPSTTSQLTRLNQAGHLDEADTRLLVDSYQFLRRIESCLRLMDHPSRHSLPINDSGQQTLTEPKSDDSNGQSGLSVSVLPSESESKTGPNFTDLQNQLADLMQYDRFEPMVEDVEACKAAVRKVFLAFVRRKLTGKRK